MARQPKQPRTTTQTCPHCSKQSVKRERRPGKWVWRCHIPGCNYKREGKQWTATTSPM